MSETGFSYHRMNKEELQEEWIKHLTVVEGFLTGNRYNNDNIIINENTMLSVIVKVDQRRRYFEYFHRLKMSEFKEAALNAFWICKLQPLSICNRDLVREQSKEYDSLNEKLALFYILRALRGALKNKSKSEDMLDSLPRKYIDELIYTFTYRDISKEAFIMLVESMAVFMGLNPYLTK